MSPPDGYCCDALVVVQGRALTMFLDWFLMAGLPQCSGPFGSAWALGLAVQTVLAIVLLA